jgi:nucleoside-diphosphate-sugar epimerase
MKKAIVIGANGYIGNDLVKELLKNNIEVLAITRYSDETFFKNFDKGDNLAHIQLDLKDVFLLPKKINEKKWKVGEECVLIFLG